MNTSFADKDLGNPNDADDRGTSTTIDYAVSVIGVKDIVIFGYSDCRAMGCLLDQSQDGQFVLIEEKNFTSPSPSHE